MPEGRQGKARRGKARQGKRVKSYHRRMRELEHYERKRDREREIDRESCE